MSQHIGFIQGLGVERGPYGDGRSQLKIAIRPEHLSPTRTVHGGVMYSLADTTMGSAVWTLLADGETCATISCSIDYLRPVHSGVLVCDAEVMSKGRRTALTRALIRDGAGDLVAQASASFYVGPADERRAGRGERKRSSGTKGG